MSAPILINRGAVSVTTTSAVLKGTLVDNGGKTTVISIYWGLTDGGTNVSAWDNVEVVGQEPIGFDYTKPISNLLPGRVYYFRNYAINADGDAWAGDTFYFATLGVPEKVPESLCASRMEAHYREVLIDSGTSLKTAKGDSKWVDPICPLSFQNAFITVDGGVSAGNVLQFYAAGDALLTFDYHKLSDGSFHYDQTWSSFGRVSYSPNNQAYNPYVTGKGVRLSVTPLYQGTTDATEGWICLKGTWAVSVVTFINPILPISDGVSYKLRFAVAPRRLNSIETEIYSQTIGANQDTRTLTFSLRGDCFWNVYVTLGANARDPSVPNGTHLCSINVRMQRVTNYIAAESGALMTTESGDELIIE